MIFLLDTDHLSILQRQTAPEYPALASKIGRISPSDLALSLVSFHEQVLGCHTYINRTRGLADVVRGYAMLARILASFSAAPRAAVR